MKLKIRSLTYCQHPMWKVFNEDNKKYDMWDRKTTGEDGITREELVDILQRRGHEIIK